MYVIRLDDASEYMDVEKWARIENLLDRHSIKPIVGIIPNNQDENLVNEYEKDPEFWNKAKVWQTKKWAIALHGYTHVYASNSGGINPVNFQSEFAGLTLEEQKKKISNGIKVFKKHELDTKIFFAPSHTFDLNTLEALRMESDIRVISDTVANNIYKMREFHFIPQQSGRVRKLPFKVTTFCYHPNTMNEQDFKMLEYFIKKYKDEFVSFQDLNFVDRHPSLYDKFLRKMYFSIRYIRNVLRGR
jgi:predicted deacetylase